MRRLSLFALLLVGLAAADARAGLFNIQMTFREDLLPSFNQAIQVRTNLFSEEIFAGLLPHYVNATDPTVIDSTTGNPLAGSILKSYCVEVERYIAGWNGSLFTPVWYEANPLAVDAISRLVTVAGGNPWGFDVLNAAAFQLAVWEIMNETSGNYSLDPAKGGLFSVDKSHADNEDQVDQAVDIADAWLLTVANGGGNPPAAGVLKLDPGNGFQSQAILFDSARFTITPEPSALAIWAGLALVSGGLQYRRRRRAG
jgi:hypothetical protein